MPTEEMEIQKRIFSKNLKNILDQKGKSQNELSHYMHVSASTVSDWIHGNKMPRMDKIQSIANWLMVQKSDLLEEKKEKKVDVEEALINEYINIPKIRELILYAGGIEPGATRDKYIEAVMTALKAMQEANKIG